MSVIKKAVIPIAGFGTRFLPATKAQPKEMLTLVDKPVIQYIVEEAVAAGIKEIIFITSYTKRAVEDHFDRNFELEYMLEQKKKTKELKQIRELSSMAKFVFTRQESPLGLGHAVLKAKELIQEESFMILSGDDVIDAKVPVAKQMVDVYEKYHDPIMGVIEVEPSRTNRYGIIDPLKKVNDRLYKMKGLVEKPEAKDAPSNLAIAGRWLVTSDIFSILEKTKPGKGGEIQLTDALTTLMGKRPMYAYNYEGEYLDCGNKLEFIKATVKLGLKHPELKDSFKEYLKTLNI